MISRLAGWADRYPLTVRLYVPIVVTLILVAQLIQWKVCACR